MKLFSNIHKMLPTADDSASTISTVSVSEQDVCDPSKPSEVRSHRVDEPGRLQTESVSRHPASDSRLTRSYKFESEDSGVELPSGADSPSTPTSSEQSFTVHSRESSCNRNSDAGAAPDDLVPLTQLPESKQAPGSADDGASAAAGALDDGFIHSEELSSAVGAERRAGEEVDGDQSGGSGASPERDEDMPGQLEETCAVTERTCFRGDGSHCEPAPRRSRETRDSLEDYMDQCCRLSEVRRSRFKLWQHQAAV